MRETVHQRIDDLLDKAVKAEFEARRMSLVYRDFAAAYAYKQMARAYLDEALELEARS